MATPEDDAVPVDDAATVPDVVEPIGAHEAPPEVGAVETWDWRSGPAFGAAPGSEGTRTAWEPTPFASFGAEPAIEPIQPAQLVSPGDGVAADLLSTPDAPEPAPEAQPFVALTGAVPPDGPAPRHAAAEPGAATSTTPPFATRRPGSRIAAGKAPGTVVAACILLWVTAIGTVVGAGLELATLAWVAERASVPLPWEPLVRTVVASALLVAASGLALHLLGRRLTSARVVAVSGAVVAVVAAGALPLLFVPTAIAAAVLLLVPASRRWFCPAR